MAQKLTPEIIQAAIEGLTSRQEAIGRQIAELRALLPGTSSNGNSAPRPASTSSKRGGRRTMSAEARERIAAAQRKRWAVSRGEGDASASAVSQAASSRKPKKRRLSAAGRKAIQEALRKRWAAKRAAEAGSGAGAVRKTARRRAAKKPAPALETA